MTPHGGKRKGAGRKPLAVPKVGLTVRLDPSLVSKLNAICKARKRSQAKQVEDWIRRADTR